MKTFDVVLAVAIAILLAGASAYAHEDFSPIPVAVSQGN
jgi:hypothetical protein